MAKKEDGIELVIKLDADQAEQFRVVAGTDDDELYDGIAKALVLGAGTIVDPQEVVEDVDLLVALVAYGLREDARASQTWADKLTFSRAQLESTEVRRTIHRWASCFGSDIAELQRKLDQAPVTDQVTWSTHAILVNVLTAILREQITRHLVP